MKSSASNSNIRRMPTVIVGAALLAVLAGTAARADGLVDKVKAKGTLTYCSDLSVPPFLSLDSATMKPVGFDIDVGNAIGKAMGVTASYKNISFDGLIPALQAGQCDAIISALFDKPERRKVVDFVDYANVGNAVIVKADSALAVSSLADLSGKKVAVERGSVNAQEVTAASDELVKQGKPAISIVALPKATDAIVQLLSGLADAFYGGTATEAAYNRQNPGKLKLAGPQMSTYFTGIATLKSDADLHDALATAFELTKTDGSYHSAVKAWSFESMAVGK